MAQEDFDDLDIEEVESGDEGVDDIPIGARNDVRQDDEEARFVVPALPDDYETSQKDFLDLFKRCEVNSGELAAGTKDTWIIHGDALLLHILLSDHQLDWTHGGQPLHVIYRFQAFLERMERIGMRIHIAFFQELFSAWTGSLAALRQSLVLYLHGTSWVSRVLDSYKNPEDPAFISYLEINCPPFGVACMQFGTLQSRMSSTELASVLPRVTMSSMEFIARFLVSSAWAVPLDTITLSNNRYFADVLSPFPKIYRETRGAQGLLAHVKQYPLEPRAQTAPVLSRVSFIASSLTTFLTHANISSPKELAFVKAIAVHACLLDALPIRARCFIFPESLESLACVRQGIELLTKFINFVGQQIAPDASVERSASQASVAWQDLWDGRLFCQTLLSLHRTFGKTSITSTQFQLVHNKVSIWDAAWPSKFWDDSESGALAQITTQPHGETAVRVVEKIDQSIRPLTIIQAVMSEEELSLYPFSDPNAVADAAAAAEPAPPEEIDDILDLLDDPDFDVNDVIASPTAPQAIDTPQHVREQIFIPLSSWARCQFVSRTRREEPSHLTVHAFSNQVNEEEAHEEYGRLKAYFASSRFQEPEDGSDAIDDKQLRWEVQQRLWKTVQKIPTSRHLPYIRKMLKEKNFAPCSNGELLKHLNTAWNETSMENIMRAKTKFLSDYAESLIGGIIQTFVVTLKNKALLSAGESEDSAAKAAPAPTTTAPPAKGKPEKKAAKEKGGKKAEEPAQEAGEAATGDDREAVIREIFQLVSQTFAWSPEKIQSLASIPALFTKLEEGFDVISEWNKICSMYKKNNAPKVIKTHIDKHHPKLDFKDAVQEIKNDAFKSLQAGVIRRLVSKIRAEITASSSLDGAAFNRDSLNQLEHGLQAKVADKNELRRSVVVSSLLGYLPPVRRLDQVVITAKTKNFIFDQELTAPALVQLIFTSIFALGFKKSEVVLHSRAALASLPSASTNPDIVEKSLKTIEAALQPALQSMSSPNKLSLLEHILSFGGPLLARPEGADDKRVRLFKPDPWQHKLLNVIDNNESALVCAPTSSGKTFISFYIMEKVLSEDDDGVVVYVCPSKSLVNQVETDVFARYTKSYPDKKERHLVGVLTNDYGSFEETCQVLVTLPGCLDVLLHTAPVAWVSRIRYIIFDEVHSMSTETSGEYWERLLLTSPVPFVALSATIGNFKEVFEWLSVSEESKGRKLHRVPDEFETIDRSNDLTLNVYSPKQKVVLPLNPLCTLTASQLAQKEFPAICTLLPEHLAATSRQLLKSVEAASKARPSNTELAALLTHVQSLQLSSAKEVYGSWWVKNSSPVALLVRTDTVKRYASELKSSIRNFAQYDVVAAEEFLRSFTDDGVTVLSEECHDRQLDAANLLACIADLKQANRLPAIIFCQSRKQCDAFVAEILKTLEKENRYLNDKNLKEGTDLIKEFLPNTFKDKDATEVTSEFNKLKFRCLLRGIAYHYPDLETKYKSCVERLFRLKKLPVVIATNSLATGINMPCRSVLVVSTSPHLTPLMFNQMIGRAGRRGLDNRGHIVLYSMSKPSAYRFLHGEISDLVGNVISTPAEFTRTVTRNAFIEADSCKLPYSYAKSVLLPIISLPFDQIQRTKLQSSFILFYCDYFISRLNAFQCAERQLNGRAMSFFMNQLFFSSPSNFVFAGLVFEGKFDSMAAEYAVPLNAFRETTAGMRHRAIQDLLRTNPSVIRELMEHRVKLLNILATLFVRLPVVPWRSAGVRCISGVPADFGLKEYVTRFNSLTTKAYLDYLTLFSKTHEVKPSHFERSLVTPPTQDALQGDIEKDVLSSSAEVHLRVPFVATSGCADNFENTSELIGDLPLDLALDSVQLPYMDPDTPLNSFLVDLYEHGTVKRLERENGIYWDPYDKCKIFTHLVKVAVEALRRRIGDIFIAEFISKFANLKESPEYTALPAGLRSMVELRINPRSDRLVLTDTSKRVFARLCQESCTRFLVYDMFADTINDFEPKVKKANRVGFYD